MSKTLLFLNPEFHNGLNATVRSGRKWDMLVSKLPTIADVAATENTEEILGQAVIVGKMVVEARDLPRDIILFHHDSEVRDLPTLTKVMREAYGPQWDPKVEVTVLFFEFRS